MNIEDLKTESFQKNWNLEELLARLDEYLEKLNQSIYQEKQSIDKTRFPVVFIVGVPRSGTTLLSQWLAATGEFCYPSNFISRFYKAPFLGGLIQELIFNKKYDYKNELNLSAENISFKSDLGKTVGILEPHEFWYFWRRFFNFPDIPVSNEIFSEKANFSDFIYEIDNFQSVFNKPFFVKSLIINPYILSFAKNMKNAIFLFIKRDPVENMISLLRTREKYFNDINIWYSFKPKEFEKLESLDPYMQVAGQVYFTNMKINEDLKEIPDSKKIITNYSDFCINPMLVYQELRNKLEMNNYSLLNSYSGPQMFNAALKPLSENNEFGKAYESVKTI